MFVFIPARLFAKNSGKWLRNGDRWRQWHAMKHEVKVRQYKIRSRPHLKYAVNYREDGKRKRAYFETKESARAFADQRNIDLINQGRAHAEFPVALRVMAQECSDLLHAHGKTIKDATDFLIAHLEASAKSCTAAELVRELVAAKERDGASARYVSDLRSRLNIFAEKFDGQAVETITSAEIDDYLRSLVLSPVTRNHYRRLIVVAFNFAMQRGYATGNPAAKTARAKEYGGEIGVLTVAQAARLLESAGPEVLPYIAIGLFAGLRRAEVQRLDWSEIDFDSGLIEVKADKSKTAQRRLVTIQPNLREWLLPVHKHRGSIMSDEFRRHFNHVRAAAGITEWPDNALRHSFASYHMAHFKNAASTALELGHVNAAITFRHYRELVKPKDAERYWNIRPVKASKKIVSISGVK
jgi:integrase